MSLEDKIEKLTAALEENTAQLKSMTGKTADRAKAKDTDDDKGEGKSKPKPSSSKAKTPTVAAMKKAAEAFLEEAGEDEDEYAARRKFVIAQAEENDVKRFSEIPAKGRADALEALENYDPDADGGEEEDNGI